MAVTPVLPALESAFCETVSDLVTHAFIDQKGVIEQKNAKHHLSQMV